MSTKVDRQEAADITLNPGEGDVAFDAWTIEELEDDLASMRPSFAGSDDAGS